MLKLFFDEAHSMEKQPAQPSDSNPAATPALEDAAGFGSSPSAEADLEMFHDLQEEPPSYPSELENEKSALEANAENSLKLCYRLLNAFDPLLGARARLTADICSKMANSKYFTPQEKKTFIAAGWLHDIGLIGFDQNILHKFRHAWHSVTLAEAKAYHQHPIRGQELVAVLEHFKGLGEIIRAHHERFDGQGYPDGFAGETIPWAARCLSVVLYYVESGLGHKKTLKSMIEQSGSSFDPDAVRLFFKMTQNANLPQQIREVMVDELTPGMRLARGIHNPVGLLLVPECQPLTDTAIAKIRNHNLLSCVRERLLIFNDDPQEL